MSEKQKPKVSVIVTAYNNAKVLPKCLDALLAQTLAAIEIICIDDASTDETAKVIREYEARDARVKGIINTENIGVAAARNLGLTKAAASYIMFCDGDDYYDVEMCEKMLEKITHATPRVDMVIAEIRVIYHAHEEMRISDENYYNLHFSGYQTVNESVLSETDFAPTNKIFRKSIIDKYQIRFPDGLHYEDAFFCAAYMCVCKAIYYLNEQLYTYVRRPGSIMSNTWSKKDGKDTSIDHVYIAFKLFEFLEQHNLLKRYNGAFWRLFADYERLTVHYSRSRQNTKKMREEVQNFINEHKEWFDKAPIGAQTEIRKLTAERCAPSKNRMKQILIKLLPTYRVQVENAIRLKTLRHKNQQLMNKVHQYIEEENGEEK